jgi:hypothetical protein
MKRQERARWSRDERERQRKEMQSWRTRKKREGRNEGLDVAISLCGKQLADISMCRVLQAVVT